MKQRIRLLGLILILGMVATVDAQTKMGYTNVELLMAYMPEVKSADSALNTYEAELSKILEKKQTTLQAKLQEYYQLKESGMSQEEDQRRVKEIQAMEQQFQKDTQEAEQKLMVRKQELLTPITTKIQEKIDEVAREGNFTYIINNTVGNGVPTILYGLETMNVTDKIASKLGISIE